MSATASYGWKVMDNSWVSVQRKTFLNWVNMHLATRNIHINSFFDFSDGYSFANFLEVITGEKIPGITKRENMNRIQRISNFSPYIKIMNSFLPRVHIDALNFMDETEMNEKLIMGMIFEFILKYSVEEISVEEKSAKQGLLLWVQRVTAGYKGVDVKNFSSSFQNGLAFIAILHAFAPNAVPNYNLYYEQTMEEAPGTPLSKDEIVKRCGERLEFAFEGFNKQAQIHKLLDYEFAVSPDDKSCITYLTLLFKAFGSSKTKDIAGRRVKKMIARARKHAELRSLYEKRAIELRDNIIAHTTTFNERKAGLPALMNDQSGIEKLLGITYAFEQDNLAEIENELADVKAFYTSLNMSLKADGKASVYAPEDASITPEALTEAVESLNNFVKEVRLALIDMLRLSNVCDGNIARFERIFAVVSHFIETVNATLAVPLIEDEALDNKSGPILDAARTETDIISNDWNEIVKSFDDYENVFGELRANSFNEEALEVLKARVDEQSEIMKNEIPTHVQNRNEAIEKKREIVENIIKTEKECIAKCVKVGNDVRAFVNKMHTIVNKAPIVTANDTVEALIEAEERVNQLSAELDVLAESEEITELKQNIEICLAEPQTYPMAAYASNVTLSVIQENTTSVHDKLAEIAEQIAQLKQKKEEIQNGADSIREIVATEVAPVLEGSETISEEIQAKITDAMEIKELDLLAQTVEQETTKVAEIEQKILELVHRAINEIGDYSLISDVRAVSVRAKTLHGVLDDSVKIIEKKKLAATGSVVPDEQLNEWRDLFNQFDMSGKHKGLEKHELLALFTSLSEDVPEDVIEKMYSQSGKVVMRPSQKKEDNGEEVESTVIEFPVFVEYMTKRTTDSETKDEVVEAFKQLAGANCITCEQLKAAGIEEDDIEFIKNTFPEVNGGYEYDAIVSVLFN